MQLLSKFKINRKFLKRKKKYAGRNNHGKITVRHQGGGNKQRYRRLDFQRLNTNLWVVGFEYDPNRNAFLAKVKDLETQEINYILAPEGLNILDKISSKDIFANRLNIGDSFLLQNIPNGTLIYNIELQQGLGGQLIRSAGTFAKVLYKTQTNDVVLQLISGEKRILSGSCKASIGMVSNRFYHNIKIGKAGKSRWLNIRPTVRGVAMNPVDHPHGGGEGKTSGGRPSVTPWALPTKGQKTRSSKKNNKNILSSRKENITSDV